jgi:hypothetical protein
MREIIVAVMYVAVEVIHLKNFFTTLSPIKSSSIPLESADRAEHVHTNNVFNALLAGMSSSSEGDGGTPSSVLPGIGSPGKTSEPIGSFGSLADYQLVTSSFRGVRPQEWEEWQQATRCPASPKKRKAEQADIISIPEDGLVQLVEDTMTRILRGFVAPTPVAGAGEDRIDPACQYDDRKNEDGSAAKSRDDASETDADAQDRTEK